MLIGLSGGLDSTVLLHIASRLRPAQVHGLYIDHQLHEASAAWGRHCQELCNRLGVDLLSRKVAVERTAEQGPEAAARAARYEAFAEILENNQLLLLAHHQDDQAETLILQLLRGAGLAGAAAMPALKTFAAGWLGRPLLDCSREQLQEYANRHGLQWVEDPSNADQELRRNFLRHEIFPRLEQQWPGCRRTLARSARLAAEANALLTERGNRDLRLCTGVKPAQLDLPALGKLPDARRRNLLRTWIQVNGYPLPSEAVLVEIDSQALDAEVDRNPTVAWPGAEVRRYRDTLYIAQDFPELTDTQVHCWNVDSPINLIAVRLQMSARSGGGLRRPESDEPVTIRFREGGERCRPAGRGGSVALKQLLQELSVPPWQRGRIPLVYYGDEMAAIGDRVICEGFRTRPGEGLQLAVHPLEL